MNAAETIAAAIEKLEADLHNDSEWTYDKLSRAIRDAAMNEVAVGVIESDAERILRWRRTIDAQLAILRDADTWVRNMGAPGIGLEIDLARAILAEVQS